MSAIRKGMAVLAAGIPFEMKVDKAGVPTASGPLWECVWKNKSGRECRRAFLEANLTPAPSKKKRAL